MVLSRPQDDQPPLISEIFPNSPAAGSGLKRGDRIVAVDGQDLTGKTVADVAQLIRGKKVASALADLEFSRKRIARDVRKCLESAIANAENNHDLDVDDLVVAEAHVGKALVIKRFTPRCRGRMGRIFKPFANLTIVVRQVESKAA